jgi:photosystem II stability/assembly factor-like uncharacterized protein
MDGGRTWTAPPNFPQQGGSFPDGVIDLAVDPQTPGTVYAATTDWDGVAGTLWKSTDGGASWQDVWPIPFSYLNAMVVNTAGAIYVAGDEGAAGEHRWRGELERTRFRPARLRPGVGPAKPEQIIRQHGGLGRGRDYHPACMGQ